MSIQVDRKGEEGADNQGEATIMVETIGYHVGWYALRFGLLHCLMERVHSVWVLLTLGCEWRVHVNGLVQQFLWY